MRKFLLFALVCAMATNSATAQVIGNHMFKHLDAEKIEKIDKLRTGILGTQTLAGKMQTHPTLRRNASGTVKQSMDSFIIPEVQKRVFSYDNRGNNYSETIYEWDGFVRDWELSSRIEFTHDNNGVLTEGIGFIRDHFYEEWVYYDRIVPAYDEDGNMTLTTVYQWSHVSNDWRLFARIKYVYDDNGNLTATTIYAWNNLTNEWIEDSRNVFIYDENGVLTEAIRYIWDGWDGWIAFIKMGYAHDNNGNLTALTLSVFMGVWVDFLREEYVFNMSYSVANLITPVNFDYLFVNKLTEVRVSEWAGMAWRLIAVCPVHWSEKEIETRISATESDDFSLVIFPNPVISELHVKSDFPKATHYTIFNTSGQIVMQGYLPENATINVASLASGIYFLNISGQTVRFVKQ